MLHTMGWWILATWIWAAGPLFQGQMENAGKAVEQTRGNESALSSGAESGSQAAQEELIRVTWEEYQAKQERYEKYEDLRWERGAVPLKEQARVLRSFGIDCVTDEEIEAINQEIAQMQEEYPDIYADEPDYWTSPMYQYRALLSIAGMGSYDEETWEWSPSSDQVYSFDMEVFELSEMYTAFLRGVSAIGQGEFSITDVKEDNRAVNWEAGWGLKKVDFLFNGTPYTWYLEVSNDWFDASAIGKFNKVLEKENSPKRLLSLWDGGQGVILFYCTAEWAEEFAEATLCPISLSY